jgi:hypothetical protein
VRVREVAGPKCRCPGEGRPRWMTETPRGALPAPLAWVAGAARRRRRAGGRPRRTGASAGGASLPWRSCRRRACAGSRHGLGCRLRSWTMLAICSTWLRRRRFPARERRWWVCWPLEASIGAVPVQDAKWLRPGNRATLPRSARIRAAPAGPIPQMSIRCEPVAWTAALSSAFIALSLASRRSRPRFPPRPSGGGSFRPGPGGARWPATPCAGRWFSSPAPRRPAVPGTGGAAG